MYFAPKFYLLFSDIVNGIERCEWFPKYLYVHQFPQYYVTAKLVTRQMKIGGEREEK